MNRLRLKTIAATLVAAILPSAAFAQNGTITFGPLAGANQVPVLNAPMLAALVLVLLFLAYKFVAPKGIGRVFFIGAGLVASGFALEESTIIETAEAGNPLAIPVNLSGQLNIPNNIDSMDRYYYFNNNTGITIEVKSITGTCNPSTYGDDTGAGPFPMGSTSQGTCSASPATRLGPNQGCEITCIPVI